MKLRVAPPARDDLREAAAWYESRRSGLGLEFLAAVDSALQRILKDPHRFGRLETLVRNEDAYRLMLDRFPYAVIFEADDREVRVLAIAHTRRRPGYWRRRR